MPLRWPAACAISVVMALDVVDLRAFYASPLGHVARQAVGRVVLRLWPHCQRQRLLGLGFATPYLPLIGGEAERVIAFMPAARRVTMPSFSAAIRSSSVWQFCMIKSRRGFVMTSSSNNPTRPL